MGTSPDSGIMLSYSASGTVCRQGGAGASSRKCFFLARHQERAKTKLLTMISVALRCSAFTGTAWQRGVVRWECHACVFLQLRKDANLRCLWRRYFDLRLIYNII